MHKRIETLGYFFIIIFTLHLGSYNDFLINNFSDLISQKNILVYIWSLITSFYTCYQLKKVTDFTITKLFIIFIILNLVIFTPYDLIIYPTLSFIHIIIAYLAFIILLGITIYYVYFSFNKIIKIYFVSYILILISLFVHFGYINSLFEIVFTIGLITGLKLYIYKIEKNKN